VLVFILLNICSSLVLGYIGVFFPDKENLAGAKLSAGGRL
jgi:hypothetical protein